MKTAEFDARKVQQFSTGSICEFEDGKQRPQLGVILSVDVQAKKGGAVYQVVDAKDQKHAVLSKSLHVVYPADPKTKPGTPPAEVLDKFLTVACFTPLQLGVDLEIVELGWEVCAADEAAELSQAAIMNEIDPSYLEGSVQRYKAFRLLTSDIGKIFFKQLHAGGAHHDASAISFRVKSAASVATAKEAWCEAVEAGDAGGSADWCFV